MVCHDREPCNNGWTNPDAVCGVDLGGSKNHLLDPGPDPLLTLPYLTFGVGGYRPPSAEAITSSPHGNARFAASQETVHLTPQKKTFHLFVTINWKFTNQIINKQTKTTTANIVWPLHRTTCVSRHCRLFVCILWAGVQPTLDPYAEAFRHPWFRTGKFCRTKVLLPTCRCWWQLAQMD